MKNIKIITVVVICAALLLGGFYYLVKKNDAKNQENVVLTEVQQVITKNLSKNYPATPREVIKFYNRIVSCIYNEEYTEEELEQLAEQIRMLFDDELLENNPKDQYLKDLKKDIEQYHQKQRTIVSSAVDSSNDVVLKKVDGDDCAYVKASYFLKEENQYDRTYQMYVLRKDADGNWKILVFYKVNGDSSNDE